MCKVIQKIVYLSYVLAIWLIKAVVAQNHRNCNSKKTELSGLDGLGIAQAQCDYFDGKISAFERDQRIKYFQQDD